MDWFLDDNGFRHERVNEWTNHLLYHFDITISLEGKKIWICSVIWYSAASLVLL